MEDLTVRQRREALLGSVAAWVTPYRLWEARHRWRALRSGGCSPRRSVAIALSGRKTNALINTRLELLPGEVLDKLRTVADIGANVGDWTAGVLDLARPSEVFVFEPSPRVYPIVRDRFAGLPGIHVIQAAIGDRDGSTPFHVTTHSHNGSVLEPRADTQNLVDHGGDVSQRVEVELLRLDKALAGVAQLDLLKIDVQGFERSVLAGAPETLRRTSWVLIEANFVSLYEGDVLLPELHDLMVSAGFELSNLSRPYVRNRVALFSDALYRRS